MTSRTIISSTFFFLDPFVRFFEEQTAPTLPGEEPKSIKLAKTVAWGEWGNVLYMCMCVCLSVWVNEREREGDSVDTRVCVRECVSVCVCVYVWQREREFVFQLNCLISSLFCTNFFFFPYALFSFHFSSFSNIIAFLFFYTLLVSFILFSSSVHPSFIASFYVHFLPSNTNSHPPFHSSTTHSRTQRAYLPSPSSSL